MSHRLCYALCFQGITVTPMVSQARGRCFIVSGDHLIVDDQGRIDLHFNQEVIAFSIPKHDHFWLNADSWPNKVAEEEIEVSRNPI